MYNQVTPSKREASCWGEPPPPLQDTRWTQMRRQWLRPPQPLHVGSGSGASPRHMPDPCCAPVQPNPTHCQVWPQYSSGYALMPGYRELL